MLKDLGLVVFAVACAAERPPAATPVSKPLQQTPTENTNTSAATPVGCAAVPLDPAPEPESDLEATLVEAFKDWSLGKSPAWRQDTNRITDEDRVNVLVERIGYFDETEFRAELDALTEWYRNVLPGSETAPDYKDYLTQEQVSWERLSKDTKYIVALTVVMNRNDTPLGYRVTRALNGHVGILMFSINNYLAKLANANQYDLSGLRRDIWKGHLRLLLALPSSANLPDSPLPKKLRAHLQGAGQKYQLPDVY